MVPTDEYEALLLIRDAQLSSQGQLSDATIKLIAHNETPQVTEYGCLRVIPVRNGRASPGLQPG